MLNLGNNRTGKTKVGVHHARWVLASFCQVAIADVHAPDKTDTAIGNKDLAVVAQVDVERGGQQSWRQKAGNSHTPLFKPGSGPGDRVPFTDPVENHPDIHASFSGTCQCIDEQPTGVIGLENIGR